MQRAAASATPVRAAMTGRGQGTLPHEASLFTVDNNVVQVTCVKQAEDGNGLIVRLCNPSTETQNAVLAFGRPVTRATQCRMDETGAEAIEAKANRIAVSLAPKKIVTLRIKL